MKTKNIMIISMLLVGCLKSSTAESTPLVVVEVKHLPSEPELKVEIVDLDSGSPPVKTWLSKEETERLRQEKQDPCAKGDPLCETIP